MKYLLVMGLVLVVFWIWRHNRETERNADAARPPSPPQREPAVTEMVACDLCHVHLPRSEALIGSQGIYCSEAHRRQAGD
jgi:uncharacterized protein